MTTSFDCALNSVLLSSLDAAICVQDIREDAPKLRTSALALQQEGRRLLRQHRESLTLHITFAIHEPEPVRRRTVLQAVQAWAAQGGFLTTTDRPGQRLGVVCTALPAMSAEGWTEALTLTFVSTLVPYWEDAEETFASGSTVLTLNIPGTAASSPVDVVVINNTEETVTSLTLRCGSTQMVFEGIDMPSNGLFLLIQSDGALVAQLNGQSVLACRTPESDDRLLAPCGTSCTAYASALEPLQATFSARGRYV